MHLSPLITVTTGETGKSPMSVDDIIMKFTRDVKRDAAFLMESARCRGRRSLIRFSIIRNRDLIRLLLPD